MLHQQEVGIGQLRFGLDISCSERTRVKLDAAARRFVQANYDAILSLLTRAGADRCRCRNMPFCITATRNAGRTVMSVSATCEPRHQPMAPPTASSQGAKRRQTNESSCEARMRGLKPCSRGSNFWVCVNGEIRLAEAKRCPPPSEGSEVESTVLVEVIHVADEAAEPVVASRPELPVGSKPRPVPLVADFYDAKARGRQFRDKYSTLRGEYFIFYSHGESICRKMLNAMGFKEARRGTEDNRFRPVEKMALMWCSGANSAAKRKGGLGYYIVNRLHYRGLITNKCSLSRCLKEFEQNHPLLVPVGLESASFCPDTIHLNGSTALSIFEKIRSHRGLFLLKPGHADCGNGIVLYRSDGSLAQLTASLSTDYAGYAHKDLLMQRYIDRPLLLDGRKFDLRVYLLLVPNLRRGLGQRGLYAFCHPGYIRLACRPYQPDSDDPLLHLTNQAVQQRDPLYSTVKEETVWSPDRLNAHLNCHRRELGVPCTDWARRRLYPRIRAILAHVVSLASSSLCDQPMSFELLGCDFLVDAEFNVWLLELNSDPSLSRTTAALDKIVTQAVEEAIGLAVEVLQAAARGKSAKRLVTRQDFRKIFSHTNESAVRRVMAEAGLRYPEHHHQQQQQQQRST